MEIKNVLRLRQLGGIYPILKKIKTFSTYEKNAPIFVKEIGENTCSRRRHCLI